MSTAVTLEICAVCERTVDPEHAHELRDGKPVHPSCAIAYDSGFLPLRDAKELEIAREECMGEETGPLLVCSQCDLTKEEAGNGECEVMEGGPPFTYRHHVFVEAAS